MRASRKNARRLRALRDAGMPINSDNAVAVTARSLATIAGMLGHEPEVLSRDAERQPRVVRIDPTEQRELLDQLRARGR